MSSLFDNSFDKEEVWKRVAWLVAIAKKNIYQDTIYKKKAAV